MDAAASGDPEELEEVVDVAIVGAVALDEIHSPGGDLDQLLGGSAVYAALAASHLARAAPLSIIGDDLPDHLLQPLHERRIRLDGITRARGPNFRWGCRYSADGDFRETLYTRAGVYDSHPLTIPPQLRRARFLLLTAGNPQQNHRAMEQLEPPELVALDTIEREVAEQRAEFRAQLHYADLVSINTLEAAHLLGWDPARQHDPNLALAAWHDIQSLGPSAFILKRASLGVDIFTKETGDRRTRVSAVPNIHPRDPTGAGDTFISALLSALARGCTLIQAATWGCATASHTIQHFGTRGIQTATPQSISHRTAQIKINGQPTPKLTPTPAA